MRALLLLLAAAAAAAQTAPASVAGLVPVLRGACAGPAPCGPTPGAAPAGALLRAGVMRSGGVAGAVNVSVAAAARRALNVTLLDATGAPVAWHGILAEAPCGAGGCGLAAVAPWPPGVTLGWAVYAPAPPPGPPAPPPSLGVVLRARFGVLDIMACGLVFALVLAVGCTHLLCEPDHEQVIYVQSAQLAL